MRWWASASKFSWSLAIVLVASAVGCAAPAPLPPRAVGTPPPVGAPLLLTTPEPGVLPGDSEAIGPGDFGIEGAQGGPIRGTLRVASMRCENPAVMQIATNGGIFSLAMPQVGAWDCQAALAQWRRLAPVDTTIGIRYTAGSGNEQVLIVNDQGASTTWRVAGAWRAP